MQIIYKIHLSNTSDKVLDRCMLLEEKQSEHSKSIKALNAKINNLQEQNTELLNENDSCKQSMKLLNNDIRQQKQSSLLTHDIKEENTVLNSNNKKLKNQINDLEIQLINQLRNTRT